MDREIHVSDHEAEAEAVAYRLGFDDRADVALVKGLIAVKRAKERTTSKATSLHPKAKAGSRERSK